MAKPEQDTPEAGQAVESVPAKPITFYDKQYTSRTLILPDRRQVSVERRRVTVEADDMVAVAFFRKRSDFEQLQE
ncbi:hypothetical protein [Pseudomonas guariconensis]|uniref:hypothetical protein n=1 Tax=Pseudomonas guariconensis TaxID=1288410 RepID=UPI0018D7E913|nr:hypothetical protein [Pseudomonas guariconensis]MBH3358784.1 hypothetical protein [Pseudomonas guariconensis]